MKRLRSLPLADPLVQHAPYVSQRLKVFKKEKLNSILTLLIVMRMYAGAKAFERSSLETCARVECSEITQKFCNRLTRMDLSLAKMMILIKIRRILNSMV